jgi:hypothetical protein
MEKNQLTYCTHYLPISLLSLPPSLLSLLTYKNNSQEARHKLLLTTLLVARILEGEWRRGRLCTATTNQAIHLSKCTATPPTGQL